MREPAGNSSQIVRMYGRLPPSQPCRSMMKSASAVSRHSASAIRSVRLPSGSPGKQRLRSFPSAGLQRRSAFEAVGLTIGITLTVPRTGSCCAKCCANRSAARIPEVSLPCTPPTNAKTGLPVPKSQTSKLLSDEPSRTVIVFKKSLPIASILPHSSVRVKQKQSASSERRWSILKNAEKYGTILTTAVRRTEPESGCIGRKWWSD